MECALRKFSGCYTKSLDKWENRVTWTIAYSGILQARTVGANWVPDPKVERRCQKGRKKNTRKSNIQSRTCKKKKKKSIMQKERGERVHTAHPVPLPFSVLFYSRLCLFFNIFFLILFAFSFAPSGFLSMILSVPLDRIPRAGWSCSTSREKPQVDNPQFPRRKDRPQAKIIYGSKSFLSASQDHTHGRGTDR